MNAEKIAREYLQFIDGCLAAGRLGADLSAGRAYAICRAVLDAAEYRKLVEEVTQNMRRFPNAELIAGWAAQLTETGNGPK